MDKETHKISLYAADNAFIQWYDARCKRVLSNRMVLAHLLRATMREFAHIAPEVIASRYIEGGNDVDNQTVNIRGLRNERNDLNREAVFFDILFHVLLPDSEQFIPIIVNVESQADYRPGYDILNRAVFYTGCLVADQKDSVFEKDKYNDLLKVCSIWVCTNPPRSLANTIVSYSLKQENVLGNCPDHPLDKVQIVLVHMGTENDDNYTGIMPLLDACLSKTSTKERQNAITKQYHVTLNTEDTTMTAGEQMVKIIRREGYEEGVVDGREEGRADGEKQEKQKIAKSMKEAMLSVELIAHCTGLSASQIEAL